MSTAYFLMNITINHENEVIRKIREVLESDVMLDYEIQGTLGIYDLVLKITAKSDDDLRHILLEKIKPIDNIQSAITMLVIWESVLILVLFHIWVKRIHNLTMDYDMISLMLLNPEFFGERFELNDDYS